MAFTYKYLFAFVALLLISCGRVPETHYYTVELQQLSQHDKTIGALLHIQDFDASTILKYDKLVYQPSLYEIKYDNYRRWAATPSALLTEKAVEYFRESGLFDRVVKDAPVSSNGFSLFGYVNHFEESWQDGKRVALVSIDFDVYAIQTKKLELHKSITRTAPIQEESVHNIMAAMSSAVQTVFDDLAHELLNLNL